VDGVEGVDVRTENSIVLVFEDAGDAGERNENGYVAAGLVNSIVQL
jgi:hypothetical protein